jgi:outer membrane protein TolC
MSPRFRRALATPAVLGSGLSLCFALADVAVTHADQPTPTPAQLAELTLPTKSLTECMAEAAQHQPTLLAARATLRNAELGQAALCQPGLLVTLTPDLATRREQSARGVAIAQAEVAQTEYDVAYSVTRMYLTAVYAREQEKLTGEVIADLTQFREFIQGAIDGGLRGDNVNPASIQKFTIAIRQVEEQQLEARCGIRRALAGLREAIGDPHCAPFNIAALPWKSVGGDLHCQAVITAAISRRGEVQQAALGADLTRLEVDAQASARMRPVFRTFATGADVHAKVLPANDFGKEYRPGAVGIEMPPNLAGKRDVRIARADALAQRGSAVADKARNLIALEAENQYHLWRQATDAVAKQQEALAAAEKLHKFVTDIEDQNRRIPAYLESLTTLARVKAAYNEAVLQHLVALAGLERATAGGVCAGLITQTSK